MFKRILIPTDFSTASEWVFEDAARIAGASGAEVIILHIRMTWGSHPDELRFPADPSLYEYAEQQELERLRDRVGRANVETRMVVRKAPNPGAEIGRAAAELGADLVVIATHARHHVAHLIVGSTTLSVIAQPPCPVLAIRYGIRRRDAMRRIVVPVHLKQTSHAALDLATRIAPSNGGEVHLLTICRDDDRPAADELLREVTSRYRGVAIKPAIVKGSDVEKEIVRYADKSDADAVFLNAVQEVSEAKIDIIRHASVPVMIVPA